MNSLLHTLLNLGIFIFSNFSSICGSHVWKACGPAVGHLITKEGHGQTLGQLADDHFWRTRPSTGDMASINLALLVCSVQMFTNNYVNINNENEINMLTSAALWHCPCSTKQRNKMQRNNKSMATGWQCDKRENPAALGVPAGRRRNIYVTPSKGVSIMPRAWGAMICLRWND